MSTLALDADVFAAARAIDEAALHELRENFRTAAIDPTVTSADWALRHEKLQQALNAYKATHGFDWDGSNPQQRLTALSPIPLLPASRAPHVPTFNNRNRYEASLPNLTATLSKQEIALFGFDTFRDRIMIAPAGQPSQWRPISDTDMIRLREALELNGFAAIPKELMRDALRKVAEDNSFDSAQVWVTGLKWDGRPRVERFLDTYCGSVDDDYTRAVSLYMWTGLAARVLEPGCQLDMVVAMQSTQGTRKSSGFQSLVPAPEYFTDGVSLQDDDENFKRLIRGKLVVEIAEMAGLSKADVDLVKRVITRKHEEWIEKWETQPTRYARRCMLFASTNNERFLPQDETGQRRWLPVEITKLNDERIAKDREQLWAEGVHLWRRQKILTPTKGGVMWRDAERLAAGRHARYEQLDVWEPLIEQWLNAPEAMFGNEPVKPPPRTRPLAISEVLAGAIRLTAAQMDMRAEKRAGQVMRQLGFEKRDMRADGKMVKRWVACSP